MTMSEDDVVVVAVSVVVEDEEVIDEGVNGVHSTTGGFCGGSKGTGSVGSGVGPGTVILPPGITTVTPSLGEMAAAKRPP